MKINRSITKWVAAVTLAALAFVNQAYALNNDEKAVLVGLAVGGIAAISVKHHLDHDRHATKYRSEKRFHNHRNHDRHHHRGHRNHHHDGGHRRPRRVEHYVIHRPPTQRYDHHAGSRGGRHNDRHHNRHSVRF